MSERQRNRTIYLDLDGVVFPYWHTSDGGYVQLEENGPRQLRSELQERRIPRWVNEDEFYYPDITKRIGQIAARGVRIIPSSSRSLDLFLHYPKILEDIGDADKYLVIDVNRPGDVRLKATAVLNNFQGVIDLSNERRGWERQRSFRDDHPLGKTPDGRAVWIDDHATERLLGVESDNARRLRDEPGMKVIAPLGVVGLTMLQLDEAEEFLFAS